MIRTSTALLSALFLLLAGAGCSGATAPGATPVTVTAAPVTVTTTASAPATSEPEPSEGTEIPEDTQTPEEETEPAPQGYTCKTLIEQVLTLSKESKGDAPTIIQVYKPKKIKDRQAAYASGDLKIPKGKTQVTVLTCEGLAALSDNDSQRIRYSVLYDVNGDSFVSYKGI